MLKDTSAMAVLNYTLTLAVLNKAEIIIHADTRAQMSEEAATGDGQAALDRRVCAWC